VDELKDYIKKLRYEFSKEELTENMVHKNPVEQFRTWFKEAMESKIPDPTAFVLATATTGGKPSARVLLLKDFDENGFVFYTNYKSRKGKEIEKTPFGAMTFFWHELQRQVRIEGKIKKHSEKESDNYFKTRPHQSKIGAWASPQSKVVENKETLDKLFLQYSNKFPDDNVPRPEHWGGYILVPDTIEFWQGRPNRFHDRILYAKTNSENWKIERLAP
jgi:pyridoxamine 5'-phosphate oxidase